MWASTSEAKAFDYIIAAICGQVLPSALPAGQRRFKAGSAVGVTGEEPCGIGSHLAASFTWARHRFRGSYLLMGHAETLNSLRVPFQCEQPGNYQEY